MADEQTYPLDDLDAVNQAIILRRSALDIEDVADRYKVTPATIARWVKRGLFPRGVQISEPITRWFMSQLVEWEQSKIRELAEQEAATENENGEPQRERNNTFQWGREPKQG